MPPTEPLFCIRPSLRSFAGLYLVLGGVCVAIWWAGWAFDTGLSPPLIALAGPVPLAVGIGYSWLVRFGAEYRIYQDSVPEWLFGVGDISVASTDQSTPHLVIRGIAEPRAVYDTLRELVARSQAMRRTMILEEESLS